MSHAAAGSAIAIRYSLPGLLEFVSEQKQRSRAAWKRNKGHEQDGKQSLKLLTRHLLLSFYTVIPSILLSIYISPAVRYLKKPPTRPEQRSGCLSQTPDTDSTRHSAYKPYSRIFNHSTCSERFSIIQVWAAEAPAVLPSAGQVELIASVSRARAFLSLFLLLFLLFNIILNPGLPFFYPSSHPRSHRHKALETRPTNLLTY